MGATETIGKGAESRRETSRNRRVMATHMTRAALVPTFFLRRSVDVSAVARLRSARRLEKQSVPTVNDFLVRAVGSALCDHPLLNATYDDGSVVMFERINVGVAMSVGGDLFVPAVYDADKKTVWEIRDDIQALAAREGRFEPARLLDATFTVTNLGMFGIDSFDPVINQPNSAILAVGSVRVSSDGGRYIEVTLGCDHRVLTGVDGAQFLSDLAGRVEVLPSELSATAAGQAEH